MNPRAPTPWELAFIVTFRMAVSVDRSVAANKGTAWHKPRIIVALASITLAWCVFGFAALVAVALFVGDSGASRLGFWNWMFIIAIFVVSPVGLVVTWSRALQGRLPTMRQLRAASMMGLVFALVIGLIVLSAVIYTVSQ